MSLADEARQRRVRELGALVAQYVPDEVLLASDARFEQACTALEHSTLGEVVRDAIAYGDIENYSECPVCGAEGADQSCVDEHGRLIDDHDERHG